MKHLLLVILMMTLGVNIVTAKNLRKPHTNDLLDQKTPNFSFEEKTITSSSDKDIITKKTKVSKKQIQGRYEGFILYYVPRYEVIMKVRTPTEVCYETVIEDGVRQFSWWYMIWIAMLISITIVHVKEIDKPLLYIFLRGIVVMAGPIVAGCLMGVAGVYAHEYPIISMIAGCAFLTTIISSFGDVAIGSWYHRTKRRKVVYVYYVSVIVSMIVAYL